MLRGSLRAAIQQVTSCPALPSMLSPERGALRKSQVHCTHCRFQLSAITRSCSLCRQGNAKWARKAQSVEEVKNCLKNFLQIPLQCTQKAAFSALWLEARVSLLSPKLECIWLDCNLRLLGLNSVCGFCIVKLEAWLGACSSTEGMNE
ncbi:hypothetical protein AAY473_029592 [Plecturocebus cupreus]